MSSTRRTVYWGVTLLLPVLLLLTVEGVLRLACDSCSLPLFVPAPFAGDGYEVANRQVGERWFAGIASPPSPMPEAFAARKPPHAFRVFVLGESSTAGFPYPRNVTFSRVLRDALGDVLADDSVEVVNLGIAATNSFTMLDMVDELVERAPDAVLIYAGHNEYYGALGVGWRERGLDVPASLVRAYLDLLGLRLVVGLRRAVVALQGAVGDGATPPGALDDLEVASLMEVLGRGQRFPLGGEGYEAGVRQFEGNLRRIASELRQHAIPVYIGGLASNLRDQPPFVAEENAVAGGAREAYRQAQSALAAGDTARASELFVRARDLDVVRFRAPSAFDDVIRRVADLPGVRYVPVREAFAASSVGGIPGREHFLEHVHPDRDGHVLIARTFFETMRDELPQGRAKLDRLRPWSEYASAQALTPLDERIAVHATRSLTSRWPFVARAEAMDYRGRYRPTDLLDSLAFAVSRGASWEVAKTRMATAYEARQQFDSAAAEYAGLVRDAPTFDEPLRLQAHALMRAGRLDEAEAALRRALAIRRTAPALAMLGTLAAERGDLDQAIAHTRSALALEPDSPAVLYQLSLLYGRRRDLANARATALRLARISPGHPGLAEWLRLIGGRP